MTGPSRTATFEYIDEAHQIRPRIGMRVDQRIPYACLRREMHHVRELIGRKQLCDGLAIRELQLLELKGLEAAKLLQARILQGGIIIIVKVVYPDNRAPLLQQALGLSTSFRNSSTYCEGK